MNEESRKVVGLTHASAGLVAQADEAEAHLLAGSPPLFVFPAAASCSALAPGQLRKAFSDYPQLCVFRVKISRNPNRFYYILILETFTGKKA